MNTKRFIFKTVVKIIIFAIFSVIVSTLLYGPIITNELALTQMEQSNELYMLMELYNRLRPFISIIYGLITTCFVGATIYDIYKFIKTKINKGEN
jgi:hypothetical protein